MDWILNHVFVLFVVAAAVANMLAKMKKAGAQQRPPQPARSSVDPDTAERTRRVQEEIRRKIAERSGRLPASPPITSPSPSAGPPARNIFQELARQMAEAKRTAEMQQRAQAAAEARAQQRMEDEQKSRELAEAGQLAEAQRMLQRQQQTIATVVADSGTPTTSARDRLLADLREPGSLRRAFVLREILGEPVGLR
jgi:type IV secretory pathway VirB10-like protein